MKTEKRRSMGCAVFFLPHFGYNVLSGLVGYRLVDITIGSCQDSSTAAQNDRHGEEKESFGTLSLLPVFTGISVTYDS